MTPIVVPGHTEVVRTTTSRRVAIDSIITGVVGLALLVVGLLAIVRTGIDAPLDEPVEQVLGFGHTALLGIAEIAIGLLLLIAAAARSRGAAILFGLALAVGGVIAAVETSTFDQDFGIESSWAWILAGAGALVVLASLLIPRPHHTVSTTDSAIDPEIARF